MKKYWIVLLFFIVFFSCDVLYEDNKRLFFTGTVLDEDGNFIEFITVNAVTYGPNGISAGSFTETLGEGLTDEDGTFRLTTLSPEGEGEISIEINSSLSSEYRSDFASATLLGLKTTVSNDAAIRLGQLRLERLVNSSLILKRTNTTNDTLLLNIITNPVQKVLYVNPLLKPEPFPYSFYASDTLLPNEIEKTLPLNQILAKDTLLLNYSLKNGLESELFTTKLFPNALNGTYEFQF